MSNDGRISPLRLWAIEVKATLSPPVSADDLFYALLHKDRPEVLKYFNGQSIPRNSVERRSLEDRIEALRYIATQVVVN